MESLKIKFDAAAEFDRYLQETRNTNTPDHGDLEIFVKPDATEGHHSAALITFHVDIQGIKTRVQTVVTLKLLATLGAACQGRVEFEESI